MEEIIKLLASNDVEGALKLLTVSKIESKTIEDLQKEHNDLDRTIRTSQVGKIQLPKQIGEGEKQKTVYPVKFPIPFQNKIVRTATAFEVGEPPNLIPNYPENNPGLSDEIIRLWRENRLDSKLQKMVSLKKRELQCAILFYIQDIKQGWFNRQIGANANKDIKSRILENKEGVMSPLFDSMGDMIAFTWEFTTKEGEKEIKNAWVYDSEWIYKASNATGVWKVEKEKHGFSNIPIVYIKQDHAEWYEAEGMIDRLETAMSKHGNANDYTGHPMLKITGKVDGAPDKDEDGKAFHCEIEYDADAEQLVQSDVSFLTYDQAPESVKMELDRLENYIYSLTSTPDISFDNIKGISNISGIAIKLMFMDAMMKAKMNNEGENRTMIQRMINVLISGTITTTVIRLKSVAKETYFDIEFNSILPDDIKSTIDMLSSAVGSKIMSQETAVNILGVVDDAEEEIKKIKGLEEEEEEEEEVEE